MNVHPLCVFTFHQNNPKPLIFFTVSLFKYGWTSATPSQAPIWVALFLISSQCQLRGGAALVSSNTQSHKGVLLISPIPNFHIIDFHFHYQLSPIHGSVTVVSRHHLRFVRRRRPRRGNLMMRRTRRRKRKRTKTRTKRTKSRRRTRRRMRLRRARGALRMMTATMMLWLPSLQSGHQWKSRWLSEVREVSSATAETCLAGVTALSLCQFVVKVFVFISFQMFMSCCSWLTVHLQPMAYGMMMSDAD